MTVLAFVASEKLTHHPAEARARVSAGLPTDRSLILAEHNAAARKAGRGYNIPSVQVLFRRTGEGHYYYKDIGTPVHPEDVS